MRAEFIDDDDERVLWLRDIDELERIADSAIQLVREESDETSREVIRLDDLVRSVVAELRDQDFEIEVTDAGEAYVKPAGWR